MTSLTFDHLEMPHDAVVVDFKSFCEFAQDGHVAVGNEGVAAGELREVVIVVPVERGDLSSRREEEVRELVQRTGSLCFTS